MILLLISLIIFAFAWMFACNVFCEGEYYMAKLYDYIYDITHKKVKNESIKSSRTRKI